MPQLSASGVPPRPSTSPAATQTFELSGATDQNDAAEDHGATEVASDAFGGMPPPPEGYRRRLGAFATSPVFSNLILGLILLNAITLGLQTSPRVMGTVGGPLRVIDTVILSVFVVELVLKLIAWRLAFFRSGWNVFDFLIVGVSLVPAADGLTVLRTLRVLRLLRLISQIPKLREIIEAIGRSLSGLTWTAALLALIFYIFGVMGTMLFQESNPEHFASLGDSLFTLFQVMTLESWSTAVARPIMGGQPWAWAYFVPFILIASFMVLNLFIAVIVNATQSLGRDEEAEHHGQLVAEIRRLSDQVAALQDQVSGTSATSDADRSSASAAATATNTATTDTNTATPNDDAGDSGPSPHKP